MARPPDAGTAGARAAHAAWLPDDWLLVVVDATVGPDTRVSVRRHGDHRDAAARVSPIVEGSPGVPGLALVLIRLTGQRGDLGSWVLQLDELAHRLDSDDLVTDLTTVCRVSLAPLAPLARARVLAFLVSTLAPPPDAPPTRDLARSLMLARDVLRERLPYGDGAGAPAEGLQMDRVLAVSAASWFIQGWVHDHRDAVTSLVAVAPEGHRLELLHRVERHAHPQLERRYGPEIALTDTGHFGFSGVVTLDAASVLDDGWRLEARRADGSGFEVCAARVTRDMQAVRQELVAAVAGTAAPDDRRRARHLFPAISAVGRRAGATVVVEQVAQHGQPTAAPRVSIVIAVDDRVDLVEHQLAQFAGDPEIGRSDLIYAVASHGARERLGETAAALSRLYACPFRVAMVAGAGADAYGHAVNAAVGLARGDLLVVLDPATLPGQAGWLGRLVAAYDANPAIGVLAPLLRDEAERILEAGVDLVRVGDANAWMHRGRSQGRARVPGGVTPVPAASAACLLLSRKDFTGAGGYLGLYLDPDFEAIDLCLRLAAWGRGSWCRTDVELYRLHDERRTPEGYPGRRYDEWLRASR